MPSLSGLLNDRRPLSVQYGSHTLQVVYRPSAYNAAWSRTLREQGDDLTAVEGLAASLAASLVEWDVTDEQGAPVPLDAGVLGSLGLGVLNALDEAITADLLPNRLRTATPSAGGSRRTG